MGSLIAKAHADKVAGMVDRARERRRGRRRWRPAGPPGLLLRADRHRRCRTRSPRSSRTRSSGRSSPSSGSATRTRPSQWANDTPFGLASSVFTSDIGRAMRVAKALEFGHVWINEHFTLASETPHGGVKQSGYGKDGSKYALEDYTFVKHVMINTRCPSRPPTPVTLADGRGAAVAGLDLERSRLRAGSGPRVGRSPRPVDEAFVLDAAARTCCSPTLTLDDGSRQRYSIALSGSPLRRRPGDGAWRALAVAMGEGRTIAALPRAIRSAAVPPTAALVCRPARRSRTWSGGGWLGRRNGSSGRTSAIRPWSLGDTLLLKAYRRLQPGSTPISR